MSAELCPVCNGSGKYKPKPDPCCTALPTERRCHGCYGSGWVSAQDIAHESTSNGFYPKDMTGSIMFDSVSEEKV